MIVTIKNIEYKCRTATKKGNTVILYLGEYDEHGNERITTFIDFPNEDIIGVEEPVVETLEERTAALEEALTLLLEGATE